MPDTPKKPTTKKGKIALYSVLGLGGVALAYYLYKKYEANAAAGTTGSTSTPADTTPAATNAVPATTAPITTMAQWQAAILAAMANIPGGENVAATGLADALSGHCVGPNEFAALNTALGSVGQPPGGGILTIKQCSASTPGSGSGSTSSTGGVGSTAVPHPTTKKAAAVKKAATGGAAATRAANAAAAARRRANDVAAAARRRANNVAAAARPKAPVKPRKPVAPQVTRATGVR